MALHPLSIIIMLFYLLLIGAVFTALAFALYMAFTLPSRLRMLEEKVNR